MVVKASVVTTDNDFAVKENPPLLRLFKNWEEGTDCHNCRALWRFFERESLAAVKRRFVVIWVIFSERVKSFGKAVRQNEGARVGMTFGNNAEQVLELPFRPACAGDERRY
jgi:hypothetical protein